MTLQELELDDQAPDLEVDGRGQAQEAATDLIPPEGDRPDRQGWLNRLLTRTRSEARWAEKLEAAFPGVPRERVEKALDIFGGIFCHRWHGGSVYRQSTGQWKENPLLYAEHLVNHLSRSPSHPLWLATRANRTTKRLTIDIDNHKNQPRVFAKSVREVEEALARLGIDANDPRQVMISPSPRGVYYHVLLRYGYPTDNLPQALSIVGLDHVPGRVEIFPSTSHSSRVPFGRIPGKPHDPLAWFRWTEKYQRGGIIEFDLEKRLNDYIGNPAPRPSLGPARSKPSIRLQPNLPAKIMGEPTHRRVPALPKIDPAILRRYDEVVGRRAQTREEVDFLWGSGILRDGTRHQVLSILAQSLIWHRHQEPEEAVDHLTSWALDPRHRSETIREDIRLGTGETGADIERLIHWCVKNEAPNPLRQPRQAGASGRLLEESPTFTASEVETIKRSVLDPSVPEAVRNQLATYLLCLLQAARRAGTPQYWRNRPGYLVAVAATVMRRWPMQNHCAYAESLRLAQSLGLVTVAKAHRFGAGSPGRARTFHLAIPPDGSGRTFNLETALAEMARSGAPIEVTATTPVKSQESEHEPGGGDGRDPGRGADAIDRSEEATAIGLAQGQAERPVVEPVPDGLRHQGAGGEPAVSSERAARQEPASALWDRGFGDHERIRSLNDRLASLLVDDPAADLTSRERWALRKPVSSLSVDEGKERNRALRRHRDRYPADRYPPP